MEKILRARTSNAEKKMGRRENNVRTVGDLKEEGGVFSDEKRKVLYEKLKKEDETGWKVRSKVRWEVG